VLGQLDEAQFNAETGAPWIMLRIGLVIALVTGLIAPAADIWNDGK
jgi:hypothetical protein